MDEIDLVLGREAAVSFLFGEGVSFERFSDEFVDFTSCRTRFFSCFMNWSGLGIPLLPLSWYSQKMVKCSPLMPMETQK